MGPPPLRLMGEVGLEPTCLSAADFHTTIAFATPVGFCGLDDAFSISRNNRGLGGSRLVSTLCRKPALARRCHQHHLEGFADFDSIHTGVSRRRAQT